MNFIKRWSKLIVVFSFAFALTELARHGISQDLIVGGINAAVLFWTTRTTTAPEVK